LTITSTILVCSVVKVRNKVHRLFDPYQVASCFCCCELVVVTTIYLLTMKNLLLFTLMLLCVYFCDCWSTFDKSKLTYYQGMSAAVEDCQDTFEPEVCEKYKDHCFKVEKVTKLCKKTCNDCRAISPLSCKASKFGCCWDNITTSEDEFGKGCPHCVDKKSGDGCAKLKSQCGFAHVRRACPTTCEVDCKDHIPCLDDKHQAPFCPLFRKEGFCKIDPELMKQYCRRTCNLCGSGPSPNAVEHDEVKKDEVKTEEDAIELKTDSDTKEQSDDSKTEATVEDAAGPDVSDAEFVSSLKELLNLVNTKKDD